MKRPATMTPRSETLAYFIRAYAHPRGWDCAVGEIAEALDESWHRVNAVCVHKGWNRRLRTVSANNAERGARHVLDLAYGLGDLTGNGKVFHAEDIAQ